MKEADGGAGDGGGAPGEKAFRLPVALFFSALLLTGLWVFRDYGFFWDDDQQRATGETALEYVLDGDAALLQYSDRHYGTAFELPLVVAERALGLQDTRSVYLMRHLATFLLFFVAVIFFYGVCLRQWGRPGIALLGCLMLVLSPRIFANAFYNTKDLPFLSAQVISIFTLLRFLEKRSLPAAAWHALACAAAIDIRVMGVVVPALTLLVVVIEGALHRAGEERPAALVPAAVFLALCCLFTVLFWPWLWGDPAARFVEAFRAMSRFRWEGYTLFMGAFVPAWDPPLLYPFVWIFITTPVLYSILFLAGAGAVTLPFLAAPADSFRDARRRNGLLFLVLFLAPLGAVVVLRSTLYDGWRQLYFVYPAFLLVALGGAERGERWIKARLSGRLRTAALQGARGAVAFSLLVTAATMARYHPYQNVYFNELTGWGKETLRRDWDLDYLGLSYRPALEHILASDPAERIGVCPDNEPGESSRLILEEGQRARLDFTCEEGAARYFVTNFRWHPEDYPFGEEVFTVTVHNSTIMAVYDTR